ncbi:MAG: hypothetical protein JO122_11395 [Acetobacteraceae bacterium]|nr:hypothetical protein [Acetobacteraceae bacterium]
MGRAALPLLVASVTLLAGLLFFEAQPGAPLPELTPEAKRAAPALPHNRPGLVQDRDARWSDTILARPLFSPTRRPAKIVGPQTTATVETPRLTGVVIAADGTGAIFVGPDTKPVFARIGDRIGPYKIAGIAEGQVTVETATGTEILHPEFAQASSATTAPASSNSRQRPTGSVRASPRVPSAEALRRMIERQEK